MRDLVTALGLRIKRGEQYHAEVVRPALRADRAGVTLEPGSATGRRP
jgi:hypothetical protein